MTALLTLEQRFEIHEFLQHEAYLLDTFRFREWIDLFTDDARYTIPLTESVEGDLAPAGHPVVDDNKDMLMARIMKDETGVSHAETPRSMTCHLIGSIVIGPPRGNDVDVYSAFVVRQARKLRTETWWAGRRDDVLRSINGSWHIAERQIHLDQRLLPRGISIFF